MYNPHWPQLEAPIDLPTRSDILNEPATFAELRSILDQRGPVVYSWQSRENSPDVLRYDGIRALCLRRSARFSKTLGLSHIEPIPALQFLGMVNDAVKRGIISDSVAVELGGSYANFQGRRASDGVAIYIGVQAGFTIYKNDVDMALAQASAMEQVLRYDGPPEKTGIALPVVAGGQLFRDSYGMDEPLGKVIFVQI